jgi:hypothetical protein
VSKPTRTQHGRRSWRRRQGREKAEACRADEPKVRTAKCRSRRARGRPARSTPPNRIFGYDEPFSLVIFLKKKSCTGFWKFLLNVVCPSAPTERTRMCEMGSVGRGSTRGAGGPTLRGGVAWYPGSIISLSATRGNGLCIQLTERRHHRLPPALSFSPCPSSSADSPSSWSSISYKRRAFRFLYLDF